MSGTYFDAVLKEDYTPIFNGTPEQTKEWLRKNPGHKGAWVCVGKTLEMVHPDEYRTRK